MAKSTIKKGIWYGTGSATGTTGISVFQLPYRDQVTYLILGYDIPIALQVKNATNATARNTITGDAMTITANGNYNFSVHGLSWYTVPTVIGVL